MSSTGIRIGILGASGYTGAELVRLLGDHPQAEIRALTAERQAGKPLGEVFPQLAIYDLPTLVKIDELDVGGLDVIFCCLPHATTQAIIKSLPRGPKIIDLSADFRLRDPALYEATYGHAHQALELQEQAVYGLSEHYRDAIRKAWLVANPGCYTTTAELPLIPLLKERLIQPEGIIIDAKSGVSGAGRDAKQGSLFTEVTEGIHAYGVATHRHTPEIEQCLADFAGRPMRVTFTPHLMPMSRGILGTIYVRLAAGISPEDLHRCLAGAYADEPFVHVLPFKSLPATRHVRGSNLCLIGVHPSRIPGEAILVSVLDNLVKGASGQAIQNMNIVLGLDERLGLSQRPLFP
ncbi:N-acetyl-gamma-glutamyl-phosphate reductase [Benzoatithermus flavus]|uniref:N-acetyl-gamma-glutamyl-phosphate reductase n=1 Tax=Benzoatithermus flavus TaxID=3108223 RepID=A0ABU8XZX4_9PROT